MSRLLISAAHKSSGKTTLSIGICAALKARGRIVQAFKKGPDYIDPMWLSLASGRPCHNLDFYTMQHKEILATVDHYSHDADISIIEGNKGLYDGLDIEGSNSNAALARLTETPVILVINVQGMTRGIAPLILGYQSFEPGLNIAGVILNQVRGKRHELKLRAVIEHYTHIPVVGAVYHNPELEIKERHLGLIPSNENQQSHHKIEQIGKLIAQQVDLEQLEQIAANAVVLPSYGNYRLFNTVEKKSIRIAVAKDTAFGFYYPGDLEALENAGAELVYFDTLNDKSLPQTDALFIGGGFPETCMEQLSNNRSLREQIRQAIENGMPAYAECGGLMYLSQSINWQGKQHEMVGVIPADTQMYDTPQGRGYIQLAETEHSPWPAFQNDKQSGQDVPKAIIPGSIIPGHEFHYSALINIKGRQTYAYKVLRGSGIDGKNDGIVYKNLLACYAHLRDTSANHWASRFVNFIHQCKIDKLLR
ncbi:MAG: hydrogenobyrinic acid a,c-diamide synthase (glutamine-hydrolyzing) [Gammaproteobacteria bacterium]|nr:hydrogenobyrinic acid a,c-diamide synthase (glutamine-hydrolyzing) [Gammaproteobacteria bacterium]